MPVNGTYPIQSNPLRPLAQFATQTQVSGTPATANRTITTPADFLTLTVLQGGISIPVRIDVSMMSPGTILRQLTTAGVNALLDRFGFLRLPDATSVTGNATLKTALGLP